MHTIQTSVPMTAGPVTMLQSSYSTLELEDVPAAAPRLSGGRAAAAGVADAVVLSVTSESLSCWCYTQNTRNTQHCLSIIYKYTILHYCSFSALMSRTASGRVNQIIPTNFLYAFLHAISN